MNTNPYSPPKSTVDTKEFVRGKWYKAILIGFLVDIVGTIITSVTIGAAISFYLASTGMSAAQISAEIGNPELTSPLGLLFNAVGLLYSVLGGYICARIANHNEYRYAVIIGIISIMTGLILAQSKVPIATHIVMGTLTFVSLLAGAYIHVSYRTKRQHRDRT